MGKGTELDITITADTESLAYQMEQVAKGFAELSDQFAKIGEAVDRFVLDLGVLIDTERSRQEHPDAIDAAFREVPLSQLLEGNDERTD